MLARTNTHSSKYIWAYLGSHIHTDTDTHTLTQACLRIHSFNQCILNVFCDVNTVVCVPCKPYLWVAVALADLYCVCDFLDQEAFWQPVGTEQVSDQAWESALTPSQQSSSRARYLVCFSSWWRERERGREREREEVKEGKTEMIHLHMARVQLPNAFWSDFLPD